MLKRTCLLIAACTALAMFTEVGAEHDLGDLPKKVERIDAFLTAYQHLNRFNGVVLVAQDDNVLLKEGYGIRDVDSGAEHDPESVFRIYSITKSFTSTVVLRLIEQGKLSLSDPVSKFYPQIPRADEITIEQLLNHTSGLYEFTRERDFENSEPNLLKLLSSKPLDFSPGSGWSYCNSGYCLLGHIVARVTGKSYEEAVTDMIFRPSGMSSSGFNFYGLASEKKATGYRTLTRSKSVPAVTERTGGPFAAGAIYSTVSDLHLFCKELIAGELLDSGTLDLAWSGCKQNDKYGLGWQLGSRWFRRKVISHSGGAAGFTSNLTFMPANGVCVAVLNNHEHANTTFLTDKILDILDGKEVIIPTDNLRPQDELQQYVGYYQVSEPRDMMIRTMLTDGRLGVEVDGRPEGILIFQDEDRFYDPESGIRLTFLKDAGGTCVGLSAKQGWTTMKATRSRGPWGIPDSTEADLVATVERYARKSSEWHDAAFRLAPLLVFNGKDSQYKELCRDMLKVYADTDSPQLAERTVKACLIKQGDADTLSAASELAARAFSAADSAGTFEWGGPVHWRAYLALAKGITDFRRRDFESAIAVLKSADAFSTLDMHSPCLRDLFLAMAYAETGSLDLARQQLTVAETAISELPGSYLNGAWHDRIIVDLIHRESLEVLNR